MDGKMALAVEGAEVGVRRGRGLRPARVVGVQFCSEGAEWVAFAMAKATSEVRGMPQAVVGADAGKERLQPRNISKSMLASAAAAALRAVLARVIMWARVSWRMAFGVLNPRRRSHAAKMTLVVRAWAEAPVASVGGPKCGRERSLQWVMAVVLKVRRRFRPVQVQAERTLARRPSKSHVGCVIQWALGDAVGGEASLHAMWRPPVMAHTWSSNATPDEGVEARSGECVAFSARCGGQGQLAGYSDW